MIQKSVNGLSLIGVFFLFLLLQPTILCASESKIVIGGCKTEYFLIKDLSDAYSRNSNTIFRVLSLGNKRAVELMLQKKIDCAFTCKRIDVVAKKLNINQEAVANWASIPIAKDPIILICNPKSGVDNVSKQQLIDIFNGKIKNWKKVGGNDVPVYVAYIDPSIESGMLPLFKEFTVGIFGQITKEARPVGSPVGLGTYVARNAGGITFVPYNANKKANKNTILKIDGVSPTKENIINGSYKLCATYYLTYRKDNNKVVSDFINFSVSSAGEKIIQKTCIPYFN